MWLNLYGPHAVQLKLKKGLKTQKIDFNPFLSLRSANISTNDSTAWLCLLQRCISIS